jgi:hypothetical protein
MKKILLLFAASVLMFASCSKKDDPENPINENGQEQNKPEENTGGGTTKPTGPDETFDIFLCFGQSNMEGNAAVENGDKTNVPTGMKNMVVAKSDAAHYAMTRYTWRKAEPPLARFTTGLTPADYFGRKMLDYLPKGHKVGIVMVAIGGAAIEAFDKEAYKSYYDNISDQDAWLRGYMDEYDGNPYQALVTAAKAAQRSGVIRGILLHQGESNNGQADWTEKVKKIYEDLLTDLNLTADKCPLLVGETLRKEEGGVCYGHNDVIAKLPEVIPTAHVISSEGCEGKDDGLHFLASGYRKIGKRYAETMLKLMGIEVPKKDYNGYYVSGRFLMDKDGKQVNLHGFGQTYSPWFNEQGTKWNGEDVEGCLKYNQGLIRQIMNDGWKMTWLRLHMDPHWTTSNRPNGFGEHQSHIYFDEAKFIKYLDEVFIPMAKFCIDNYGMAVVMRPPGVCGEEAMKYGDDLQKYLLKVWSIVSAHPYIKNNPDIMFELANEPVKFEGGNQKYSQYFQDIVDAIRINCDNVCWIPGLAWQQNYKPFAEYPIQGINIGYAVHCYPGWYGSPAQVSAEEFNTPLDGNEEKFRKGWAENVGCVAKFAPVIVTEMDWSPHEYNDNHHVAWGSSTTTAFGAPFKKIADEYGNVSWMIFTSPHLIAKYKSHNDVDAATKGFLEDPEGCVVAAYNWYNEYAEQ